MPNYNYAHNYSAAQLSDDEVPEKVIDNSRTNSDHGVKRGQSQSPLLLCKRRKLGVPKVS